MAGLIRMNLHVFNASQISFNYLIGHLTTAHSEGIHQGFRDVRTSSWPTFRLGLVRLLTAAAMLNPVTPSRSEPDGDGSARGRWLRSCGAVSLGTTALAADRFRILIDTNHALPAERSAWWRHRAARNSRGGAVGGISLYGALGTTPFASSQVTNGTWRRPTAQMIHFLSVADDYNGSNNAALASVQHAIEDISANISPAATTYVLQVYDSNEHVLTFTLRRRGSGFSAADRGRVGSEDHLHLLADLHELPRPGHW